MLPWFWFVGAPAAGLVLLALVWTASRRSAPAPPPVQEWEVRFVAAPPDSQVTGFDGNYRPGELLFAPPGTRVACRPQPRGASGSWRALESAWSARGGRLDEKDFLYTPQRPGLYHLVWQPEKPGAPQQRLNVLIMHPAEQKAAGRRIAVRVLDEYIGTYGDPKTSGIARIAQHASRYQPPRYFAVLDRQTLTLEVGHNLELGQLVAFKDYRGKDGRKIHTQTRHTHVLPPSKALCDKLSLLLERLQSQGVKVTRFYITSGFRTPTYNRSIGGATYSRHCYGDAVDLAVDEDGDHRMDDLNGDGRSNRLDGLLVAKACVALEREGLVEVGGIGVYEWDGRDSVGSHVHIDCRGHAARWGQIARGRKKLGYNWWSGN